MGKDQAIRRSIAQLKFIQAQRRRREEEQSVKQKELTRLLSFGVCDSISFATKSTGKPLDRNMASVRSAFIMTTVLVGFVFLAAFCFLSMTTGV